MFKQLFHLFIIGSLLSVVTSKIMGQEGPVQRRLRRLRPGEIHHTVFNPSNPPRTYNLATIPPSWNAPFVPPSPEEIQREHERRYKEECDSCKECCCWLAVCPLSVLLLSAALSKVS